MAIAHFRSLRTLLAGLVLSVAGTTSCSDSSSGLVEKACTISDPDAPPDFLREIPCRKDFMALASEPIDTNLPGARSTKVVLDTIDADALYFQNSLKFRIHYDFVSTHLSGGDLPIVPQLAEFNATQYYGSEDERRFFLGAVTYYEEPDVWALEIAPYDTATAPMIERLYDAVSQSSYFGPALAFHPSSESIEAVAEDLREDIPVVTTDDLYSKIDYQPLSLGTAIGRLHFTTAASLATEFVPFRDIVVLDEAPNDISVVAGIITQEFQTPLSHVNVLSRNRGTPNMGLRNALEDETLRALENKWVELVVEGNGWSIREATQEEADAYWEAHRPDPVVLPPIDLSVTDLRDIEDVTVESDETTLREAIVAALPSFGGKAAHYSVLANTPELPVRKAFAVPVFYYDQFMADNGFYDRVDALLVDAAFVDDPSVRETELQQLRDDMMLAPVDMAFQDLLRQKLAQDYPGLTIRFRTSTNSEDLEGFPCAGCYESHTGDPAAWPTVLDAVRETWASIWLFRTFEERSYYGVDHKSVGMALLVHHNFPAEEANGVAVTNNPFDASGLEPALYINVQHGGDAEVVHPPAGVTSDQFLYYFDNPNQPITFISHSNLVPDGETVLTLSQTHELGLALEAIHDRFSEAYGPAAGITSWYGMDVEFKFDDEDSSDGVVRAVVKQARPYPAPEPL